uniref:Mannose receptor, C type 1b n=1 Tax=Acanthochromis polyacanthus TaxID=80966 RepID=A0A3Q1GW30_9TELE
MDPDYKPHHGQNLITWSLCHFRLSLKISSESITLFLRNVATGFCLVKRYNYCFDIRWTTGDRLLALWSNKCLGAQGKSVGSEITLYDCDETSELQKWECKNETVLALKGEQLYIELTAENTAVLSKTIGPNNHLTISGTSSGACSRTYREIFTLEGNAFGKPCMFPFLYKDQWYSDCTTADTPDRRLWCAVETKYEHELWGYCPTNSKENWKKDVTTGANYQLNTQSALTWSQADASCKQQGSSLLSITDPHEKAYITGKDGCYALWTGLTLDPEHGWQWSNGRPFRYLNWDSGHPLSDPGQTCGIIDGAVQYSWQSSKCNKKLGYICYSKSVTAPPTEGKRKTAETGFCSTHWIPYNGHCFQLFRTALSWSDAQKQCRKDEGDLVSIRNVEDQSFVISQLGYASNDELWIGLNDRRTEGLFDWSDHSTVSFTSWEYGKPAVTTDQSDCVLMRGESGNWADRACTDKHGFICMKTSASEPSGDEGPQNIGCNTGWKKHGSYCYFVGTQTKTFNEAKEDCESSGSYMADVSTGVDNAFLVSLVGLRPEKHFWLGLSNQKNIDFFEWTNANSVKYTHWNTHMPGHQQGCVAMATGRFAGLWDVLPCTNKEKYICKHLAVGAVLTTAPPTVQPVTCALGWNSLSSRNVCYQMYSAKKTWYEAKDYCRAIGGDLLSIHSESELQTYQTVWIGLNAPNPVTGYVWSDGSPLNFQNWEDGEPNNKNGVESCVEFKAYYWKASGSWNDVHCEKINSYACQIRRGECSWSCGYVVFFMYYNSTSDGWRIWQGNQYYFNSRSMAMEEARHFCKQRHGDLVTINSEEERLFLWRQISRQDRSFWIGLTVDLDRSFQWMDGSQVVFQRWEEGQPDFKNYDENCAVITHYSGFWHDYNCGYEHGSICKRSDSLPVNTTVAPTTPPQGGCPPSWKKFHSKVRCHHLCKSFQFSVFLMSQMAEAPTTDLWIGFNNFHNGRFLWTDGRPTSYVNLGLQVSGHSVNYDSPEPTIPTSYIKILNDSVKVVPQQMNWDEAKKNCDGDDAILASLRNEWMQAYVELLVLNLKAPLWIGLNKMQTNGYFKFVDGWHISQSYWGENEPSTSRPCVYVDVDGKWKTAYCNQTMNSVCMKSTDKPPPEPTGFPGVCPQDPDFTRTRERYFWKPYRGYCYIFFTDTERWTNAASSCARHGGMLASIEDSSEQEFIESNVKAFEDSYSSFWMGLFKTHKGTAEWLWLDRTVMDYTKWGEGQPSDNSFGEISTSDGTWKAGEDYYHRPYICKTPKDLVSPDLPRDHMILAVVLGIAGIVAGAVIIFFIYKKHGHRLPIPDSFTTFDNPLFFNNKQPQPDLVDTSKLVENAEEEHTELVVTM